MSTTEEMKGKLEQCVDDAGLETTLALLADVCAEKAQHIRECWQDEQLARTWDRAARAVLRACRNKRVERVPC